MLLPLLLAAAGLAAAAQAPQLASYDIDARLDMKARAIHGREVLTWVNDSPDTIRELRFHLYMNAFRNGKSSFLRNSRGRIEEMEERKDWGWIDIQRFQIQGGPDLTRSVQYLAPDDGNPDDRTVMSVQLPEPIKPGATARIEIDFFTKMPREAGRTGCRGDYCFVAQWFPKIGVWEQAGERYSTEGQWNCHQYHANTEFYADFGRYAVNLTAPAGFTVVASGVEESSKTNADGTVTRRFVQEDIHDFAWAAQRGALRLERVFNPAREVSAKELADTAKLLGLPESEIRLDPVKMILFLQPEHATQADVHFKALATGLKYFGLWYGKYPYRTITCVDPPWGAGTGGMEYPTLITAGTDWIDAPEDQSPEMVTVHEFGHQFWYALVANNEFEEAWLDEGFNTYSTSKILDLAYGPFRLPVTISGLPVSKVLGLPTLDWDIANRGQYVVLPKADSLARNGWEYSSGSSYGINSYARPGIVLRTLENYLGQQTFARIMRTYHQRWRYRHPCTRDFIQVVNEVSGQDLNWFFQETLYSSNVIDYGVDTVRSRKPDEKKNVWDSTVTIRRYGEAVMPVEIRIRFKNGEVVNRQWDGRYRWVRFEFSKPSEVESVEVDPYHKILLDTNFANNSFTYQPPARPLLKWSANLLFWAQNVLLMLASLA